LATRVFSDEELAQLRGFPEVTRDELIRSFTLTSANRAFVDPGRRRSARDRLGLAVQLHVDAGALAGYGERAQTRTDHLRLVLQYAGWRVPRSLEVKELDEFLLARAMEHDSPSRLFRRACETLRASQVLGRGAVSLGDRVAAARPDAGAETACPRHALRWVAGAAVLACVVEMLTTTPTSRAASCAKTSANGASGASARAGNDAPSNNVSNTARMAPRAPKNGKTHLLLTNPHPPDRV